MGPGREANRFMASSEFNVEPGDESMNEVVTLSVEAERHAKG